MSYVGQTGDSIHKRFGAHVGSVKRKMLKEDVNFWKALQSTNPPWNQRRQHQGDRFMHTQNVNSQTPRLLIVFHWIQRLGAMLPLTLNAKDRTPRDGTCQCAMTILHFNHISNRSCFDK